MPWGRERCRQWRSPAFQFILAVRSLQASMGGGDEPDHHLKALHAARVLQRHLCMCCARKAGGVMGKGIYEVRSRSAISAILRDKPNSVGTSGLSPIDLISIWHGFTFRVKGFRQGGCRRPSIPAVTPLGSLPGRCPSASIPLRQAQRQARKAPEPLRPVAARGSLFSTRDASLLPPQSARKGLGRSL